MIPELEPACPQRRRVLSAASLIAASIVLFFGLPACGSESRSIAFVNATIIDGSGAPPKRNQVLLTCGTRICLIGESGTVDVSRADDIVDATGKFLVPGFIDTHVHFPRDADYHEPVARRLLEFGITTVLNAGAVPAAGIELRDRIRRSEIAGPRMLSAGEAIDMATLRPASEESSRPSVHGDAMREEIRRQHEFGVDFIKLYAGLTPDLVETAIEEAHALGLPVMGHLERTGWTDAARMGIDMLVHSGWTTPMEEIIELEDPAGASDAEWYGAYRNSVAGERFDRLVTALLASRTFVVPTLSISQASALGHDASLLPVFETHLAPERDVPGWWGEGWRERHPQFDADTDEETRLLRDVYMPALLDILRAYHARGVRIAVGSDVGNAWMTPGVSFHHELELYQQAGIAPADVLVMATRNGAASLGLEDRIGMLTAGRDADIVVLEANPLDDVRNTRSVLQVYLAGRPVGFHTSD